MNNPRNLPILRTAATDVFCSICPDPGHCCRQFVLQQIYWKDEGLDGAQKRLEMYGVPFLVTGWGPQTWTDKAGREYAFITATCPKVTEEGLCSIYETRPETCRNFAAGSDRLCVFVGMNGISFDESKRENQ